MKESPANARATRRRQFFMGERDETSGMRLVLAQS
jgi:hypothetical protein